VGAFLVLVVLLGLATVVSIGRGKDWFKSYVDFYAVFEESYNLQEGADVKIAKTTVGRVEKITLTDQGVRVDLAIQEEYASRIRGDTTVTVESPTLIGDEYLSIKPGRQDLPVKKEGGRILSMEKKSFSDILEEFQVEETAKKFVAAVQKLSDTADTLSDPKGPLLATLHSARRTMSHVEAVVAGLERGEGTVGGLLRSDELLARVQDNIATVEEILSTLEQTARTAPETAEQVRESARGIREMVDRLSAASREVAASVEVIAANVEKGSRDVPEVTRGMRKGIEDFRRGMGKMEQVADAIKKNPLVRGGIPPKPEGTPTESGMRVR